MRRTRIGGLVLIVAISAASNAETVSAQTAETTAKPYQLPKLLDFDPTKPRFIPGGGLYAGGLVRPAAEMAEAAVRSGWDAFRSQDHAGAMASFEEAVRVCPSHAPALYSRGAARLHQGDLLGAIADYDESIRLDKNYWQPRYGRGCALMRCGDLWAASDAFTEAIATHSKVGSLYTGRAEARLRLRDAAGARADAEKALAIDPNDWRAESFWLTALDRTGDDVKLRTALDEMVRADPADVECLAGLAFLLASSRDAQVRDGARALTLATEAVAQSDGHSRAAFRARAAALAALGDFPKAVGTSFRAMFTQMPNPDTETDLIRVVTYLRRKPLVKEVWDAETPDRDRHTLVAAFFFDSKTVIGFKADCDRAFWFRAALPRWLPIPMVPYGWNSKGVTEFVGQVRAWWETKDNPAPKPAK